MKKRIKNSNIYSDEEIYPLVSEKDLWIFDKFHVSLKAGHICGPAGISVPVPGEYVIRPCMNILGMGMGAFFALLNRETYGLPSGTFWCERFIGPHYSVDYYKGKQQLCVIGHREHLGDVTRWKKWEKNNIEIPYPHHILDQLEQEYDWVNVEYIGDKIVEIHLRRNPDFKGHDSNYVIPVYKDQVIKPARDQLFVPSQDEDRLGFYIQKKS